MAFFQGSFLYVNQREDGVADLRIGGAGEHTSLLNIPLLNELEQALDRIADAGTFRLLFVHVGKSGRIALGLDLGILAQQTTAEEWRALAETGQRVARRLAGLAVPTVAMISGSCAGPDLQIALACDYRIVVEKPGMQIGFPELELGLLPFWGAGHRLPRLIGLERAINLLLTGRRLRPKEALAWDLVDAVAVEGEEPPAFLENPQKQVRATLPRATWRQWFVESHPPGRWLLFQGGRRLIRRRFPDDMPGPTLTLDAMRAVFTHGVEAAEKCEVDALVQLGQSPAWKNLLHLHQAREALRVQFLPKDRKNPIQRVGVVGVAQRGGALAVLSASHNCNVVLQEKDDPSLGAAVFLLLKLFEQELARSHLNPAEMKRRLNLIKATTNYRDFRDLEIVLFAGDEPVELLGPLLRDMEARVSERALIASTNPAVSLEQLAGYSTRPDRLVALHFQVPAGRSLLIEVAPSPRMSEANVRRLMEWLAFLGRTPRRVPDGPGLLFNRLLLPTLLEAILLVKEGIRIDRIDQAMLAFGLQHGPLEHLDLMGADAVKNLVEVLYPTWNGRIPNQDTFNLLLEKNWLGQKVGIGFYRYRGRRKVVHHRLGNELRERGRRDCPQHVEVLSRADQKKKSIERLLFLTIAEASRCMEEGYLDDPAELDLTLALGGWAPHHGGPLTFARTLGKQITLERMKLLEEAHGERYRPSPWLQDWLPA